MLDHRLNYAVAVARGGSFTKAAEIVGVTQPAITKSIAGLEHELGFAIFYRTARGALLTEEGREFIERAARLLDDAKELLRGSSTRDDPYAGPLRIGVCPSSLEWRIADPLAVLLARHPRIRIEVVGASFERMIQVLRGGGVDVAFGFEAAFSEWTDLQRVSLPGLTSRFFVRKGHPLLERPNLTWRDISEFDMVSPSNSRPYGKFLRDIFEREGIEWQQRTHTVDYFPTVKRIVATTDAVSVVEISHAATPSFISQFEIIQGLEVTAAAPLCCAVRSRWDPKASVRAFINVMREDSKDRP